MGLMFYLEIKEFLFLLVEPIPQSVVIEPILPATSSGI